MKPMEPLEAAQFFCPHCSAEVSAAAEVCPRCGAALAASSASASPSPAAGSRKPERKDDLLDNRWVILALLFLATGALGLPLLWRSRGFTTWGKIVVGVIVTIYTLALIALAIWAVWWAWESVQETIALGRR
jgi:hypothetical protein